MHGFPSPARLALLAIALVVSGCHGCSKKHVATAQHKVKAVASARIAAAPRPPPPPPPPPRNPDGSYSYAGLRYLEFVTGNANPNEPLPMIVALHGHGGDPEMWVKTFSRFTGKARFIAPFGFHPGEHGGWAWFPAGADHAENEHFLGQALPGIEAHLARSLIALRKARPTTGKMIVTGFSQGGTLAYALALFHGSAFAISCPAAGAIPPELFRRVTAPSPPPEVHAVHGSTDPGLPRGKRTIASLKRLGFVADMTTVPAQGHYFEPSQRAVTLCLDRGLSLVAKNP
ncbi:MAG TPA: alpha/beta hydrolase-fold protein [Minicystis sp.]|nr:alpha/beta hydrolase-fold protein [Minicystis sp.]